MAKVTVYNDVAGLNASLRSLDKLASAHLRDASVVIAADIASKAQGAASSVGGVAKLVGPTIRATRDRIPVVTMGGNARTPSGRGAIGDLIWGAEFGGGSRPATMQFKPWLGHTGYFLWPTVRGDSTWIQQQYSNALGDALDEMP